MANRSAKTGAGAEEGFPEIGTMDSGEFEQLPLDSGDELERRLRHQRRRAILEAFALHVEPLDPREIEAARVRLRDGAVPHNLSEPSDAELKRRAAAGPEEFIDARSLLDAPAEPSFLAPPVKQPPVDDRFDVIARAARGSLYAGMQFLRQLPTRPT